MMRISLIVCVVFCVAFGCSDKPAPVEPDPCSPFPCDTCNNYFPPPTGMQGSPAIPAVCWMRNGKISPDRRFLVFEGGNSDYAYSHRNFPIVGLAVMEMESGRIIHFIPGFFISWTWDHDSKTVYFIESTMRPISALNIETKEVKQYPHIGRFEGLNISPSGTYMFCYGVKTGAKEYGLVRWNMQRDTAEFISNQREVYNSFMVLNDSVVCSIIPGKSSSSGKQGIYYYNVETKELKHVECPGFGDELAGVYRGEISPDKKQVIFDPVKPENNDRYLDIGVWVLNLGSLEVRQILPRHPYYRFKNQYPVWSTNSSFVAQWFCLKDSTLLLYEYDLTGKPLRQLTKRSTKFWEVL